MKAKKKKHRLQAFIQKYMTFLLAVEFNCTIEVFTYVFRYVEIVSVLTHYIG